MYMYIVAAAASEKSVRASAISRMRNNYSPPVCALYICRVHEDIFRICARQIHHRAHFRVWPSRIFDTDIYVEKCCSLSCRTQVVINSPSVRARPQNISLYMAYLIATAATTRFGVRFFPPSCFASIFLRRCSPDRREESSGASVLRN